MKIVKLRLILLLLALFSCYEKKEKKYTETIDGLFDTTHFLVSYVKDESEFKKYVNIYKEEMEKLHKLYTGYEKYNGINNINVINENAGKKEVKVEKEIIDLLEYSIKLNKEVNDNVNIASGKVIELLEKDKLENIDKFNIKKCIDINNIVINKKENTVFLKEECTKINVGAIAKGFAVEKVAQKLEKMGADSFLISAGGNVRTIGKRKNNKKNIENSDLKQCEEKFCVGITLPLYNNENLDKNNPYNKKTEFLSKIVASDLSVVTTGNYQRYIIKNNKVQGHILNLKTLKPEDKYASVTVITKDSGFADFMSTTLFLLSFEEGKKLVEGIDGLEAIWAMNDGEIRNSSGLIEGENFVKYNFK